MTEIQLSVLQNPMEGGDKARCVQVERKGLRHILKKLRSGTAELRVETGRRVGMKHEDRTYAQCNSGEVEDVEHFLLRCGSVVREREREVVENGRVS